MRRFKFICLAILAAMLPVSGAAAATATTTFQVQIVIGDACEVLNATNLSFGALGVLASDVDATSTVSVQCTNLLPHTIGLDAGTGVGATVTTRKMTGPGGATVNYSLYQDVTRLLVWGSTIGLDAIAAVGVGIQTDYTVYGRVPAQATPVAGTYTDTITITVTY